MDEAVFRTLQMMEDGGQPEYIVTPNPEIVMAARQDEEFMAVVNNAFMVLPDGIGIIYGAKILGTPIESRIPGIDFITNVFEKMDGKKLFLFGAKPGVAEKAAENIKQRFPNIIICGTNDGYFTDDEPIIEKINAAAPDLLLVCLGAPKQEKWMAKNAPRLNAKMMAGLGGSLDVFAGIVERAPESWQKLGLEWLYRLKKEPKRIGRMMKLPKFVLAAMGQRLRGGKNG
jgi:N-acetylglucosaminyldiphosphoundecaprenol N-acetyl-beta-D-mannosaminyltransferase